MHFKKKLQKVFFFKKTLGKKIAKTIKPNFAQEFGDKSWNCSKQELRH